MKVAYLVSRFPHVSETFILRELDAVAAQPGIEVVLCSLFPAAGGPVHDAARPWMARLRRPSIGRALADLTVWGLRRPARVVSTIALIARAHRGRPALLVRALATVPLACSHARMLRRDGVQHIHAHYATYPALAAWVVHRLTGIGYSFTAHAHDIYVDRSLLERKLRDARFAVTISDYNRRLLERERGTAHTPVHVVRCGIDPARYPFRPRRPPASGPVAALCVASLQEYKGHRVLLDAIARSDGCLDRLELDLVGDGRLRHHLERQARGSGIGDRVRFHGSLPEDRVRALLDRACVFVLPSVVAADGQMEGLPVALMEALACGLVVVSTRLSGIPELIRDGVSGYLAEPGDPASLANALTRALSPESGALALEQARELVAREYDAAVNARRLTELLTAQRA